MTGKKDLTRIEDLSEYLHELEEESSPPDFTSGEEEVPAFPSIDESVPEIPDIENDTSIEFGENTEESTNFETTDEDNLSFNASETSFDAGNDFAADDSTEVTDTNSNFDDSPAFEEKTSFEETPSFESNTSFDEEKQDNTFETSLASSSDFEVQDTLPEQIEPIQETKPSTYQIREDFKEEVKKFTENTSINNNVKSETQPAFSIIIRNVVYQEDKDEIIDLLKEYNALAVDEVSSRNSLERGALLVPRLSEFSAIFLCHKLRRFNAEVSMGLSDLIHPTSLKKNSDLSSNLNKKNLYQNQSESFSKSHKIDNPQDVQITTTSIIEGHQVKEYLGILCEHEMLEEFDVLEPNSTKLLQYYDRLSNKLKISASNKKANAIIGLQYQLTNVAVKNITDKNKYLLQATANAVWIEKNS
jgi:uncharacterized protein YbjQ (UPF0145 family)